MYETIAKSNYKEKENEEKRLKIYYVLRTKTKPNWGLSKEETQKKKCRTTRGTTITTNKCQHCNKKY